ncbi:MAG: hypothetical protein Q7W30_05760 [Coriobacteriia bacterium]|nr:hypothetical protein [Coriobacteriia bacterium]
MQRFLRAVVRRPVLAFLATVLVGTLLCAGGAARDWAEYAVFAARAQALALTDAGPVRTVDWSFRYRGSALNLRVRVPRGQIDAARALPSERVFLSGGALREAYMTTLVRTQSTSALVGGIALQFRRLRDSLRLDDDRYVELIADAVQEIPYGTPREHVSAPAGVLADSAGVCTEKSILLAAILLHEGYDTALFVFDTQAHVAVGVRGAGPGLRGSGYAFIETTRPSYVGEADGRFLVSGGTTRALQLVRLGGDRTYASDIEAAFTVGALARTRMTELALAPYPALRSRGAGTWRRIYAGLADRHAQTTRLADWMERNTDDRTRVYALLTRSGGR